MHLSVKGINIKLIGDPHLGKEFVHGVPLNRRGEREKAQMDKFFAELEDLNEDESGMSNTRVVVMMGDLFDRFRVSNEIWLQVFEKLMYEASWNRRVDYVMIRGNHDVARNSELVSSFDMLAAVFENVDNVHFITEPFEELTIPVEGFQAPVRLLFSAYQEFGSTNEHFTKLEGQYDAVFGHWDTQSFGNDHNVIPYSHLIGKTPLVVTGHEHNGREIQFTSDLKVLVTGSMLPYSHAEDPKGDIYVTITLEEYQKDPTLYHNKAVRIQMKKGEERPSDVDALQVSFVTLEETEEEVTEVKMEAFSMKETFYEALKETGTPDTMIDTYWNKYKERNSDAAQS